VRFEFDAEGLIRRRALVGLRRRLQSARVVVVNGPRQSGKTALLGMLRREVGGDYVSLDSATVLASARADPTGFVTGFAEPLMIDEVQRGGDALVTAIKLETDRTSRRGRFVLAGSTRFLTEPRLSESLAGRARFVDLWPLSQGEIDSAGDGFVDAMFESGGPPGQAEPAPRREIMTRICRGGFPEAVLAASERDRTEFLLDYGRTITQRDIRELADLEHAARLRDLLRLIAARTSQEANLADLARALSIPAPTLRRYLPLFETIYAHHLVPAWSGSPGTKTIRRPKLHMIDSGLAAALLGVDTDALARPTSTIAGQLLETFVAGEVARQLTWSTTIASLHHWRDRDGAEVDLVIEASDGRVVGVEVKAAVDVHDRDFAGLRALRSRAGERFHAGVLLHCGDGVRSFGPGLTAAPVSALWAAG
jgi:predicted AAA+ superfamily ATPase